MKEVSTKDSRLHEPMYNVIPEEAKLWAQKINSGVGVGVGRSQLPAKGQEGAPGVGELSLA